MEIGRVTNLTRYPIKSMLGEALVEVPLADRGVLGDRAYALVDERSGHVVSAKNPRKWARMFELRATYDAPLALGSPLPPARIAFPDGTSLRTDDADAGSTLSAFLGSPVRVARIPPERAAFEIVTPDLEDPSGDVDVTEIVMPPGAFFDGEPLHLLTTGTLAHLKTLYPGGQFAPSRFRPNVLIDTGSAPDRVEERLLGQAIDVGAGVRLRVTRLCGRCVMTTLPQGDLGDDRGILATAVRATRGRVGAYALVERGGTVRTGDSVRLAPPVRGG